MFLQGLQRILNCSKAQVAATGLASTWLAVHYAAADLPPTQRSALWIAFIGAVAVQLREIINAWTEEDVANIRHEGTQAQRHEGAKAPSSSPTAPFVPACLRASVPAFIPFFLLSVCPFVSDFELRISSLWSIRVCGQQDYQ